MKHYVQPGHTRSQVDQAGEVIAEFNEWLSTRRRRVLESDLENRLPQYREAIGVMNNWRSSHSYPMLVTRLTLDGRARKIDPRCLVAQRLKRQVSITAKLSRQDHMALSRMQDIGGCRAVLRNVNAVGQLMRACWDASMKNKTRGHELIKVYDYIDQPKEDGYRGIHLVYRFRSQSPKLIPYNGLRVEVQLRSRLQHAWATSVETTGMFLRQSLKSHDGSKEWLRFFTLMGSAIAVLEGCPSVAGTPRTSSGLRKELRRLARRLRAVNNLHTYNQTIEASKTEDSEYYLLISDPRSGTTSVEGFAEDELDVATLKYEELEKDLNKADRADAVLVSVKSFAELKKAYPNYFADTRLFASIVENVIR